MTAAKDYVLDDFDRAILAALPDVGEKIGKYLDKSMEVPALKQAVDPVPSSGTYGARLRLLWEHGYIVKVKRGSSGSRGMGWQRSAKGKLAASIIVKEANG